ncbi:potassium voltage-gated channel subfamily G member 4 [Marmota marmota marmota]|uniref:potassium voltage-gated channel subfamily G member 4 n=1 Tax=Marmota marmota marmota TaxID=9994 RepID=UPI0020929C65|nr:potassium voltage-gated channel subfamily G member 4 [Marmota marmota marmota]
MPVPSGDGVLGLGHPHGGSYSPLSQLLPGPLETRSAKGLYYRRARRLGALEAPPEADLKKEVLVNVGGHRFLLPWSTLDAFPLSRLSQLRLCRSREEIGQLCDDFDEDTQEFFFDRSPSAFAVIASFLAAGKLVLLQDTCALSFREELAYWGIAEGSLERCCLRRLLGRLEEAAELRDLPELTAALQRLPSCPSTDPGRDLALRKPHAHLGLGSSWHSSSALVQLPGPGEAAGPLTAYQGECSHKCYYIFVVETICVAWFSLEFCLRFVQARNKCQFFQGPLNIIDILAISPYYVSLVVSEEPREDGERPPSSSSYLEKVGLVLRVLRALRILYVMRLARHSLGLQTLGLTVRRCAREFGLLLLFLAVAVTLFSPLVYLAENESGRVLEFTSIPASYWWAIISMTTVGYGDMVPRSVPGQMVALSSILSGILIMAFPATSIFHTFSHSYLELKKEQEWLQARLRRLQHTNSDSEHELLANVDDLMLEGPALPVPQV